MSHFHSPHKVKIVGATALLALSLSGAHAASLGKLTVLSSLGQPLRAEVELVSVAEGEAASLTAKLAPIKAFQKSHVDYNPALSSLRFEVVKRRARRVIRITSTRPMNDPFIALLLEVSSDRGSLVREYTFLLDPPELRAGSPAQVVAPAGVTAPTSVPAPAPAPKPSYAPASPAQPVKGVKWTEPGSAEKQQSFSKQSAPPQRSVKTRHRVRRGQSLHHIAQSSRLRSVPLEQALVALYRANPRAFMKDNMNLLQVGKVLRIPDAETAGNVSIAEARQIVAVHEKDFANYRQRLAGRVAKAEPVKTSQSGRFAGGRVSAAQKTAAKVPGPAKDRLKVSRVPGQLGGKGAAGMDSLGKGAESDAALADANARIQELEKNLNELKALLQVRSQSLAAQQKQAESQTVQEEAAPEAPVTEVKKEADAKPTEEVAAVVEEQKEAPLAAAKLKTAEQAVDPLLAKKSPEAPKPVPKAEPKPKPKKKEAKSMAAGFLKDLMQNKMVMGLVGVLLLLLLMLRMRKSRQKKDEKALEGSGLLQGMDEQAIDEGGSVEQAPPNNDFLNVPPASSNTNGLLDAEEVDALAEAEVYLAYGRENQAIDVLKTALRHDTERNDYRMKLLDIYAEKGDVYSFNTLASELHVMTQGEGAEWEHVSALGASIAPNNPLFEQAEESAETVSDEASEEITAEVEAVEPESGEVEGLDAEMEAPEAASEAEEFEVFEGAQGVAEEESSMADPLADMARMNPEDVEVFEGDAQPEEAAEAPLEFESVSIEEEAVEPEMEAQQESQVDEPLEFDLSGMEEVAEQAPASEAGVVTESEAKEEALPPLDFDLGDLVSEPTEQPDTIEVMPVAEEVEPSDEELERFAETNLGEASTIEVPPVEEMPAFEFEQVSAPEVEEEETVAELEAAPEVNEEALPPLDFDMGDLASEPAEQADTIEVMPVVEDEAPSSEQVEAFAEADLGEEQKISVPPVEDEESFEPKQPVSQEELEASEPDVAPALGGFDFSSINLDLDSQQTEMPDIAETAPMTSAGRLEVDTKLELADAYMGIGDKEGARELFEEVLQEGSEEQIARAQEGLAKIS